MQHHRIVPVVGRGQEKPNGENSKMTLCFLRDAARTDQTVKKSIAFASGRQGAHQLASQTGICELLFLSSTEPNS
jgi:hypothetical protein